MSQSYASAGVALPGSFIRAERITSAQVITTSTGTTVILNSIIREDDPVGRFSLNTSTGVLTINEDGWYSVSGGILWEGDATPVGRRITTCKGDIRGDIWGAEAEVLTGLTSWGRQTGSGIAYLVDTEEVTIEAFHSQGADLDVLVSTLSYLAVAYLGV